MQMDNKWAFYWRIDVPFVNNDIPSADNPDRDREFGLGDLCWGNRLIEGVNQVIGKHWRKASTSQFIQLV